MQDRPDAHELLEALEAYLRDDLLAVVPPEHRFGVRVAANVCAILARETQPLAPDRRSLDALCREIRSGAWDDRLPALAEALRTKVRAKLDVDHPGWAGAAYALLETAAPAASKGRRSSGWALRKVSSS